VVGRAAELLDRPGAALAAVTLDSDGAVVVGRGVPAERTAAHPAPASHAVGAGDAYLAAFVLPTTAARMPVTRTPAETAVVARAGGRPPACTG
jgi:D-beta-D-heptose 7-phosphate kinase/D-beta-D-heptose 1-phosphate adenosyltransferase